MKGADISAALGHCIRSSVPELHLRAGLLPSLDCEPPFPLSLGSLVNDAPDATGRWFGGTEHCCQGRAFPIPYTECGQLEGCCEDQPELTAPCSLRGEAESDNYSQYLFSPLEGTCPRTVTLCPSWRPPSILPVKGTGCGEETAVSWPSSFSPSSPALTGAGLGVGQQPRDQVQPRTGQKEPQLHGPSSPGARK